MTVLYSITEKGRNNLGSFGGHLDRILKALALKPRTSEQLEKIVAKHSDSSTPSTISTWYCSQAHKAGYMSRKVID
jgi:hypothetical protein